MSEKSKRFEGRENFFENNKIKFGVMFLLIAVLLAFVSIHSEAKTYQSSYRTLEGRNPDDPLSGWESLEIKNSVINSTLFLEYTPDGENSSEEVEVEITDFTVDENRTITLDGDEPETVSLDDNAYWIVPKYNESEGNVTYRQEIVYTIQPFSILTIPAFVLTIFGIIITYSGQAEFKAKLAEKRMMAQQEQQMQEQTQEDDMEENR
ncbi:MAG: hypothetical protein ACQESD_07970 [Thermoplasmatota archaeon]